VLIATTYRYRKYSECGRLHMKEPHGETSEEGKGSTGLTRVRRYTRVELSGVLQVERGAAAYGARYVDGARRHEGEPLGGSMQFVAFLQACLRGGTQARGMGPYGAAGKITCSRRERPQSGLEYASNVGGPGIIRAD